MAELENEYLSPESVRARIDENIRQTVRVTVARKIRRFVDEVENDKRIERRAFGAAIAFCSMMLLFGLVPLIGSYFQEAPAITAGPRTVTVSGPGSTPEHAYFKKFVEHLQRTANENPSPEFVGKGGFGSAWVSVRADGSLESVRIAESFGSVRIDQAMIAEVKSAFPFEPFPDDLRRKADVLVFGLSLSLGTGKDAK